MGGRGRGHKIGSTMTAGKALADNLGSKAHIGCTLGALQIRCVLGQVVSREGMSGSIYRSPRICRGIGVCTASPTMERSGREEVDWEKC